MTQILINFLQPLDNVPNAPLETSSRVFDFEIDEEAQAYYTYQLARALTGLGASIQPSSGGDPVPVTPAMSLSQLKSGTIVFGAPGSATPDASLVSEAINLLNNWSKMKIVNAQNFQTYSFGNIGTTIDDGGTVVATDSSGKLLSEPAAQLRTLLPSDAATFSTVTGVSLSRPVSIDGTQTTVNGLYTTMNQYMAQGLDKLIRALRAAGWDPIGEPSGIPNAATAIANITGATTSSIYGIASVIERAISAAAQAHLIGSAALTDSMSIQQVLMVDYVSRGNEILFAEMQKLRDAIDLNQSALSYLNSLQDLMNQKDPQKFIMQLQLLNGVNVNPQNPQGVFDTFEKQTYDQSLGTLTRIQNSAALQAYFNNLATGASIPASAQLAVGVFDNLASAGNVVASYSVTQIIANLNYLASNINGQAANASGGLVMALNKIKADFSSLTSTPTAAATALRDWIQDTQAGDAGVFQRNLSNGIVSSQSFNDTQREKLREVMFVFEEFYKSATGLLSRLTQLLEKMADGIAR